jgi:hypothetical protein
MPALVAAARELCQKACFPDSRLAADLDRRCTTVVQAGEKLVEHAKLGSSPDEVVAAGHFLPREHRGHSNEK